MLPIATAAAGVAGGVVLGRTTLQQQQRSNRKILGITVPTGKVDFSEVSKQIGEAGRQLGRLAGEVQAAREKAERISRAIS